MALLLGLDFGTGGVRVGLFDLDERRMRAEREAPYATTYPHAGWAEQSPAEWWEAAGAATRGLLRELGQPEVAGICVATTASTVVACRKDGTPLRPALLWMDCRAAEQADRTAELDHPVLAYAGGSDAAEWLVPKAMWLNEHEPDTYRQAEIVCECLDWVNFMLSGRWVGSRMNATCKWNYDSVQRRFHSDLYAALGIPGLPEKLPAEIVPVGGTVGPISATAMAHLGLSNRPVLAQGGIDAHVGMVGANTIAPGEMLMIGGTSVVQLFQLGQEQDVSGFWGPYPHALVDDHWLVEAGQVSAGSVLSWFAKDMFRLDDAGLKELVREAAAMEVGSTGLLTLDYFMGNRTPYRDPHLRGTVLGLSLGHDRAALYRSAVEGVALGSANVLRRMNELGISCRRVVSAGGFAKNRLWLQATVDAIGMPVQLATDANLSILGAAACAATGAGLLPDLFAAADAVAPPTATIEPEPGAHARYAELLEDYLEATRLLAPLSRRLAARQRQRSG
ncbi:MAG TPA: FGGY-family carbohydrate kinase [Geminicoccus sp.]|uniref:FGGY-family carbohydrate kinase n=1 Tax=Geminicoccus sp. TaxID=2024832 RepID=UPI002B6C5D32|nr:FGGY-family carbohydrate kinase [Geminicoccus sp.]HWL66804.1 FGGY-family carbohydrate kinase [Geminicoccus sp.]